MLRLPIRRSKALAPSGISAQVLVAVLPVLFVLLAGCSTPRFETEVAGPALGTSYSVKVISDRPLDSATRGRLQALVTQKIDQVDQAMSTYRQDSELSRLNLAPAQKSIEVSPDLFAVLEAASNLSSWTGGAFDVTVAPLVNAWGFGPVAPETVPNDREIDDLLASVGDDKLSLDPAHSTVTKALANVSVDLSAIAKGLAVDRVAVAVEVAGYLDHLVEIGGEVRARGRNRLGTAWTVAIESPPAHSSTAGGPSRERGLQRILSLDDSALATSGDYRNYFEIDGQRYSHTIDPRTGRPVRHRAASVSVLHPEAMWADGWATALLVLGPEQGLESALARDLAALFLVYNDHGGVDERSTPAFDLAVLANPPRD